MPYDAQQRWDRRYRETDVPAQPSALLTALDELLPRQGRALDVAGGAGRHAVWLARRGLEVWLVDVSPVAVARAAAAATAAGVTVHASVADLAHDPPPPGPWDLVVVFHYLQRDLFPALAAALAPGGLLVATIATVRNLERQSRPPREYLLEEGEAPSLAAGLDVVRYEEGWLAEGRHEALLVARRVGAREGG